MYKTTLETSIYAAFRTTTSLGHIGSVTSWRDH